MGEFVEGEDFCKKGLFSAHKANHLYTMGVAEMHYGFLFTNKGDGENVVKHWQNCIGYYEKSQAAIFLPSAWSALGLGYYLLGDLKTALIFMEKDLTESRIIE